LLNSAHSHFRGKPEQQRSAAPEQHQLEYSEQQRPIARALFLLFCGTNAEIV
jgi:hypothetical protein